MIENYHVVEWSPSQKCFHIQTIIEMVCDNMAVYRGESMTDYLPIGIFKTYEQASDFIRQLVRNRGIG